MRSINVIGGGRKNLTDVALGLNINVETCNLLKLLIFYYLFLRQLIYMKFS